MGHIDGNDFGEGLACIRLPCQTGGKAEKPGWIAFLKSLAVRRRRTSIIFRLQKSFVVVVVLWLCF